ncbi:MAG TPA: ATP-grasp domain-containing protein [Planctomycetota bacterium]|jgi:predicted ATP-grasp superfamily ATP-dependent carboligase|nr:ATP-grasp domain-containing protein [Planctomycetota bacterium]
MTPSLHRTILVTDAGRGSAIAVIRSLGRAGWRVVAAADDPRAPGLFSRFARERLVYPDPKAEPSAFVEAMLSAARTLGVDLIVPVTDQVIHPLAHARERFRGVCALAVADPEALAIVTDKERTLDLARSLGVPVPETRVVRTLAEARAAAADLRFPLVLKPAVSRVHLPGENRIESCQATYAADLRELERRAPPLLARCKLLLQEYFAGVGIGVELLAFEGRPLLSFQHRRLAEVPVTGGASAWRESEPLDPVLFEHARRFVAALRWTGLMMVEFKVGEGERLMEINGRVWGSLPLAVHCGVDFPAALASVLLDGPHQGNGKPGPAYPAGVRAYDVELLLSWIAQVLLGVKRHPYLPSPSRRAALPALLALLDPRQKPDVPWRGDPRLALARWARIGRTLGRKVRRLVGRG